MQANEAGEWNVDEGKRLMDKLETREWHSVKETFKFKFNSK